MSNFAKRTTRIVAGTLAGALALSVTPILGLTGIASAADALPPVAEPIGAGNFCEGAPTTEPFTDVSASDPSFDEIVCLVATKLTKGTTATTYSPNASITRRQMALFIKRMADLANKLDTGTQVAPLPAYDGTTAPFTDIAGESAETKEAIGQLEQSAIVLGTTATTYSPGANVSRRQMAAFINRLEKFLTGAEFTTTKDFFNDDAGDTGAANLNALASVGIFQGDGAGNVFPGANLTRRQMANILLRHAQVMMDQGDIGRAFPPPSTTSRPELTTATIVSTTPTAAATVANPAGTVVRFAFDEPVSAIGSNGTFGYWVFRFDEPNIGIQASSVAVDASNANAVLARFNGLTGDPGIVAARLALVTATVKLNAVLDAQGVANPEGAAALGTGSTTTTPATAGRTSAPDPVSVAFRVALDPTMTAVDVTFDQAAYTQTVGGTGFAIVLPDLTEQVCTGPANSATTASGGTNAPGGNGTTTITLICDNIGPGNGTLLSAANISRLTVDALAVGTTPATGVVAFVGVGGAACGAPNAQLTVNRCNPLEAADTPDVGTIAPDLVSVRFVAGVAPATDTAIYTFDQAVATAPAGPAFGIYKADGTQLQGNLGGTTINVGGGSLEVAVPFPNGATTGATGGNVADAAVTGVGAQPNQQDEAAASAVTTPPSVAPAAGATDGPDLVSVVSALGGPFNTDRLTTYTFDAAIADAPGAAILLDGRFRLYLADGTGLVGTTCVAGPATTGLTTTTTVVCSAYNLFTATNNDAPSATAATNAQMGAAVLGTIQWGAVMNANGESPEGDFATTGGTGTPSA